MNRSLAIIAALAALIVIAVLPLWMPPFYTRVVQLFFFSAALATAWNILGGYTGYWSFGHTVFIGIGAFASAHLVTHLGPFGSGPWSMVVPVLLSGLICGLFAAILAYPILRLRGIYFAIAMLGVGQVVGELVTNISWFQGGVGVFLAAPVPQGMPPEQFFYYLFAGLLILCLAVSFWVRHSRFGYALLAIREDEDTAMMLGVATERYKIAAFVMSAVLVGLLGAVYGYTVGYFTTSSVFRLDFSLNMIVFCLIGGIGTLFGPVIGTAVMLLLTQVLLSGFLDIHLLITGVIVVAIILIMPGGILGALRPKRRASASKAEPAAKVQS
ncbi:branched-chain amino acid ABC transporter permease [Pseudohoeflea coraliihabitans]|uniref:Branched-chain amino acid ABC transporter permease n=1 Tax=Pseudohoeflea coraliihabitans TaxID=2860393 RepID=A0ABS6WND7_9HYPH|nr:branched-chain amino acid ABC transporter permease [Pseudohoeflea sp. DP4N28-3]MBW3097474.1 branched-chain amino acid ABC transporter permease [Pseudohoeflea sp. DP4N28-3]